MSGILSLESSKVQAQLSSAKTTEINGQGGVESIVFLVDGKHVMSGRKYPTLMS